PPYVNNVMVPNVIAPFLNEPATNTLLPASAQTLHPITWAKLFPTALFAQITLPELSYFTTNIFAAPALVKVVVPKVMEELVNTPVTITLPFGSEVMSNALSSVLPPIPFAQSTLP